METLRLSRYVTLVLHAPYVFIPSSLKYEALSQDLLRLASGYDEDVAAIACFDIGEFAKHYPNGRMLAKSVGVRDVVMKLIDHENPELQRHALLCVSKILIQNPQVSFTETTQWVVMHRQSLIASFLTSTLLVHRSDLMPTGMLFVATSIR
jgi:V-ATPase subunit H